MASKVVQSMFEIKSGIYNKRRGKEGKQDGKEVQEKRLVNTRTNNKNTHAPSKCRKISQHEQTTLVIITMQG